MLKKRRLLCVPGKAKIYGAIPDPDAQKHHQIRVIDKSGKDYWYPESYFIPVTFPKKAAVIAKGLALAAEHAACAHHLLAELVLSRVPRSIKRLRMWFHPSEQEKTSKKLLENGHIFKEPLNNSM